MSIRFPLLPALIAVVLFPCAAAAEPISAPDGLEADAPARPAAGVAVADPQAAAQWQLEGDQAMGMQSAWRITTGGEVVVAVIDSGADLDHADLAPNLWTNAGEVAGNGVDDDGDGVVDDVHGVDLVEGDGHPQDANGHGTHVAGLIAARGGNGIAGSGVAWRARLMIVRVLDAEAAGDTGQVARGIRYAVAHGARVINLSLAGSSPSPDLMRAIDEAAAAGVLVVVAAGNHGRDLTVQPTYPAAYRSPNLLAVAATSKTGALSVVSGYGAGVQLAAPGEDILSTALGGGLEWRTGTSMAAPLVTGTAVLLAAARPDLDGHALRDALIRGARVGSLPVEAGAVDAAASLRAVGATPLPARATHATRAAAAGPRVRRRHAAGAGRALRRARTRA